jgi:2,4-dienoyl-CoA reductase-like NADH-dependent reductase (Old Yellow Enzyme family)
MKALLDTTTIGSLTLKNRFIRSAVGDHAVAGHLDVPILQTYENLAQGGVGTIITGFATVDEAEKVFTMLAMYEDSFVGEYQKLTDKVHAHGTNIMLQLVVTGSYAMGDVTGRTVPGPSAVANLNTKIVPAEMKISEIKTMQKKFGQAALRAKKAGFDGIEIHGAHGFLLSQFIAPYYNRRTDIYGGSIENRARMLIETYSEVRTAVGKGYPVWIKLNSSDGIENGMTFDDCLYVSKQLADRGADAIEVSGSWISCPAKQEMYFKEEAATIAKRCQIPVILTGGNRDFRHMEQVLNSTGIGYFGMARPFISEPDLVNRFIKEHPSKTKCVTCNGCIKPDNIGKCVLNKSKKD